ncbi:MAG: MATE family efflux transporter [Clostridia bacterium]|nr:MATE family efflux transporter [Clostridia bacterium]
MFNRTSTETAEEKAKAHYIKMTQTPVIRLVASLGLPTTVSMLITNIYNMADTYFVGELGETPQGAMGILFALQAIIQAVSFMLGHGSGTYAGKELAEGNVKKASTYVSTAFFAGGAVGLLGLIFGLTFLEPLVRLLGSTETILPYAKDYGFWVLLACPVLITSIVLNNNLRYEGKAVYAMVGLTSGGILNIFLDYLFIRKLNMGVYGAGLATALSQAVSFILLLIFFFAKAQSKVSVKYISKDVTIYLHILKNGFPSLLRQGLTSISHGVLNNLSKPFGDAAIAALSIINRYSSFVMCVGLGIGQGFQPVASFNYTVGKYSRVKKGFWFTVLVGGVLVGTLAGAGAVFAKPVVSLFQSAESVIQIGVPGLRVASLGVLFHPIMVPVNMMFQSIRRSVTASFLAMLRSGLVFIPVLFLFSSFFGLRGILCAQPAAEDENRA